jgi:hypothetical protein
VCPLALRKGRVIGENSHFKSGPAYMVDINAAYQFGPWWMPKNSEVQAYLGLSFFVKGQFHFGWARVKVQADQKYVVIAATLTGYAYETIPNKPIIAGATKGPDDAEPTESFNTPTPEPSTLGMLALGAPGLSIWRRKESALQSN